MDEQRLVVVAREVAASLAAMDAALARVAPWLVPQQRHYLVGGLAVFTALVGAISVLFVWIASRQVRPRQLPPASGRLPPLPTSPASKRMRRSRSFTDLDALERDRKQENAVLDQQDRFVFPRRLRQTCRPEDLKLVYDALSKVRLVQACVYVPLWELGWRSDPCLDRTRSGVCLSQRRVRRAARKVRQPLKAELGMSSPVCLTDNGLGPLVATCRSARLQKAKRSLHVAATTAHCCSLSLATRH